MLSTHIGAMFSRILFCHHVYEIFFILCAEVHILAVHTYVCTDVHKYLFMGRNMNLHC